MQRRLLIHERHLVDLAVAGDAADALVHVDAVVEVHEIRQIVDADPGQGLVVAKTGPHRLQNGRVIPDLRVAVHARLGRGDVGEGGFLDRRVAIPAIESHAADVMGVAELDRLFDEIALFRVYRRGTAW